MPQGHGSGEYQYGNPGRLSEHLRLAGVAGHHCVISQIGQVNAGGQYHQSHQNAAGEDYELIDQVCHQGEVEDSGCLYQGKEHYCHQHQVARQLGGLSLSFCRLLSQAQPDQYGVESRCRQEVCDQLCHDLSKHISDGQDQNGPEG